MTLKTPTQNSWKLFGIIRWSFKIVVGPKFDNWEAPFA